MNGYLVPIQFPNTPPPPYVPYQCTFRNDICLQCFARPKRANFTFCSSACTQMAAMTSPALKAIPPNHVLYAGAAQTFFKQWPAGKPPPNILAISLVTWTEQSRDEFDTYRDKVEKKSKCQKKGQSAGNEQKLLRGVTRACSLGEPGYSTRCHNQDCRLCEAVCEGFKPYLDYKIQSAKNPNYKGARLGPGIYMSDSADKAADYAVNLFPTNVKVIMICRAILGNERIAWTSTILGRNLQKALIQCTQKQEEPFHSMSMLFITTRQCDQRISSTFKCNAALDY
ncbi:hypothetical protein HDV64DRAFT_255349 [Trichoderma sp. TUCIM 5745]